MTTGLYNIGIRIGGTPKPTMEQRIDAYLDIDKETIRQRDLLYETTGIRFRELDRKLATNDFAAIAETRRLTYDTDGNPRVQIADYAIDSATYRQAMDLSIEIMDANRYNTPIRLSPDNPAHTIPRHELMAENSQLPPDERMHGPFPGAAIGRFYALGLERALQTQPPLAVKSVTLNSNILTTTPGNKRLDEVSDDMAFRIQKGIELKQAPQRIAAKILPGLMPNNNSAAKNDMQFE